MDLATWTEGFTPAQIWARPLGLGPIGFHMRHIAGSTDRLFTYAEGRMLSEEQIAQLKGEMEEGASREELLAAVDAVFQRVGDAIRKIDPDTLRDFRGVGRKQLPATVAGLLMHIAEHNMRHVGEAIITAKVVAAKDASGAAR